MYVYNMSGALLQLAALSSQDVYLTGNPEITLFKKNYMRYTYFAVETVQVPFNGDIIFGSTTTANLDKTGDLISKMVLVLNLQQLTSDVKWGYVDKIGHAVIDNIAITIGNTDIDRRYNDWIDIYQSITKDKSQKENYDIMIGNVTSLKNFSLSHDAYTLYIPLEFWTGKLTSSAFPICALSNNSTNSQNFQVTVTLRNSVDCINYVGSTEPTELPVIVSGYLLVDYVYLENEERNLFIDNGNNPINYLIEVVDRMESSIVSIKSDIDVTFYKATKYLIWYAQLERFSNRNKFMSWATDDDWETARNEFAKIVWLVTRSGLNATTNPPTITFDGGNLNIGEELPIVTKGNTLLQSLAAKVSAIILFATTNIDGDVVANATIDNVVLTSNTITFEDMSSTIDEIKAATAPSAPIPVPDPRIQQNLFMDTYHTNSIIDIFNYGNFINRSDNPIISSSFKIRNQTRFQERYGFFYNYLQPYYYFKNSPSDGVNIYTFSLNPEDVQPSGTINFSKIDPKTLTINLGKYNNKYNNYLSYFGNGTLRIFGLGYNSLTIVSNSAQLTYYK